MSRNHDTGRWYIQRKAYRKARVRKPIARFYKRIGIEPSPFYKWSIKKAR